MTPEQLRKFGEQLFGAWGWQTKLAKTLRVDSSTVRRWISGTSEIPGPAEVALELLLNLQQIQNSTKVQNHCLHKSNSQKTKMKNRQKSMKT